MHTQTQAYILKGGTQIHYFYGIGDYFFKSRILLGRVESFWQGNTKNIANLHNLKRFN